LTLRACLRSAATRWNAFFHAPVDVRVPALLRIGYASLLLVHWLVMLPSVVTLWSERGVLPIASLRDVAGGFVPTLFTLLPRSNGVLWGAYALFGVHVVLLLLGYRARLQAVMVLVWLVSFQNRNPLVTNGQDALLRLIGCFLALLPIGDALSLDARAGRRSNPAPAVWPLRLLQLQITAVMLDAALWKLSGDDWTRGTALYYVTRLDGFWGNFPVPEVLSSPGALRAATYATLALELSLPIVIWIPKFRRAALGVAIAFHLTLAYAMNLFLFPWVMVLGWCSFSRREDFGWLERLTPFRSLARAFDFHRSQRSST
jgi:hypothetical protein